MGTTLTGSQIQTTYDALIKVTDNGPIGATPKLLTDGLGNDSKVALGTLGTNFTGTVDFSGATVTGLPDNDTTYDLLSAQSGSDVEILLVGSDSTTDTVTLVAGTNITLTDTGGSITIDAAGGGGGGGLVSGTGTDSLKNDDSLVTTPAVAACPGSIALGNAAIANPAFGAVGSIVIGCGSSTARGGVVVLGAGSSASDGNSTIIGYNSAGTNNNATALGHSARAGNFGTSLGTSSCTIGSCSIGIGYLSCAKSDWDIAIGTGAVTANGASISIGRNAINSNSDCSIAIGFNSCVTGWSRLIAIGCAACHVGGTYGGAAIGQNSLAYGPGISIGCNARAALNINGYAIGQSACVTANGAVALGTSVTASRDNTVTGCQMEACVAGKGIVVTSPDGLTTLGIGIDNSGNIVTYTP